MALRRYPHIREIVWVQEEPGNMGALAYVLPKLEHIAGRRPVRSMKRSPSASPATGSAKAHAIEQTALVNLRNQLVIHVGDVDHPVDFIAEIIEVPLDRVEDYRPLHVANVTFLIDRGPAQIDAHLAWLNGFERFFGLGECVVNAE